eukprot:TRINITY_DN3278_c0_g1_i1.p1 TRINITY_DN3278_c0_g1~~TRINITY_DN3278_c0_g1_i1.p1  ORF type:complete len:437 (+),score=172.01 TRINITY_DN3278_c0_g1_i1:921-2231(+)
MGANVSSSNDDRMTHLVMKSVKLTIKTMTCLARAKPIVTLDWLRAVVNREKMCDALPNEAEYLPPLEMEDSLNDKSIFAINEERTKLFVNKTIVVMASDQFKRVGKILHFGGGDVIQLFEPSKGQITNLKKQNKNSNLYFLSPTNEDDENSQTPTEAQRVKEINQVNGKMITEDDIGRAVLHLRPFGDESKEVKKDEPDAMEIEKNPKAMEVDRNKSEAPTMDQKETEEVKIEEKISNKNTKKSPLKQKQVEDEVQIVEKPSNQKKRTKPEEKIVEKKEENKKVMKVEEKINSQPPKLVDIKVTDDSQWKGKQLEVKNEGVDKENLENGENIEPMIVFNQNLLSKSIVSAKAPAGIKGKNFKQFKRKGQESDSQESKRNPMAVSAHTNTDLLKDEWLKNATNEANEEESREEQANSIFKEDAKKKKSSKQLRLFSS